MTFRRGGGNKVFVFLKWAGTFFGGRAIFAFVLFPTFVEGVFKVPITPRGEIFFKQFFQKKPGS